MKAKNIIFIALGLILIVVVLLLIFKNSYSGKVRSQQSTTFYQQINDYVRNYEMQVISADTNKNTIRLGVKIGGTKGDVELAARDEDSTLIIYCYFPSLILADQISSLSCYLMQWNSEHTLGNFEIDTTNRLLMFRNTVDCRHVDLTDSTIYNEIGWTIQNIEEIIPVVLQKQ
jgi:hypothetical protein